jgi:hypothetical protein
LSKRMVRLVNSGRRLPWAAPRGLSIKALGPSVVKRRFQCLLCPWKGGTWWRCGSLPDRMDGNRRRRLAPVCWRRGGGDGATAREGKLWAVTPTEVLATVAAEIGEQPAQRPQRCPCDAAGPRRRYWASRCRHHSS